MKPITIDGESADRITALVLSQHRDMIVKILNKSMNNMSDSELARYTRLLKSITILLEEYFEVPML